MVIACFNFPLVTSVCEKGSVEIVTSVILLLDSQKKFCKQEVDIE